MKKIIRLAILGYLISNPSFINAQEYDSWAIKTNERFTVRENTYIDPSDPSQGGDPGFDSYYLEIYEYDYLSGTENLKLRFQQAQDSDIGTNNWKLNQVDSSKITFDNVDGKIHLKATSANKKYIYDIKNNSITTGDYTAPSNPSTNYQKVFEKPTVTGLSNGEKNIELGGKQIISQKSDGSVHIGENSAVFKEENGREKFWAQDANGKAIPIDITNGSKLLINGRDVEQSINNIGALSAALTGLPTVPTDTTLACGLGTGTHGGDFAFSGGCASQVNEKLSINYAASMTMPGQDYAGDFEDQFSARAGFVWKLGKSIKPTQISMKAKEKMEAKIFSLEKSNKKIISQNEDLKQKNQLIISQNKSLLARLEKLEKIALGESKSKDLATIKLP